MKEEVKEFLKIHAKEFIFESSIGTRQLDAVELCRALQEKFPEITVDELRAAIPEALNYID